MTFGERVNHLRVTLGFTSTALAFKARLKVQRVVAIERGGVEPNTRERLSLARALDVSEAYLMTGDGTVGLQARPAFKALVAQLEDLAPAQQDSLCAMFAVSVRRAREGRTP